ncbi:SET domain-containing protein SmydA-8 [Maniola jurtina]|uniref:SET domain-containing protein SmydA-8 n=1 Tax=Maniola jurtina TaxID=191418 RepID=UPI001E68F594|nr:SET domain-containing protein SmydA-8 [Maniola jurtina]XP_045774599.1 SET domain-containing protein SmydA-8 [Maniola jurtina]
MGKGSENGVSEVFEVHKSEELGRYLVAARDLTPGEVIVTELPLVFGPKAMIDPEASMPCVGCYKPVFTDIGERCSRCGWPVCSGNCPGLKDPRHHGLECDILSARPECVLDNMAEYYRHDALLPLRCVLLQNTNPEKWRQLLELQSHMEYRIPGSDLYDEADEFIVEYLINSFISKLEDSIKKKYFKEISKELLHRMCGIIDTNALEIRLPGGSELNALYATTCLLEHSCIPNTKHVFGLFTKDKSELYRITLKVVVPIMKGHHIATMYSHALWGTQARRQHLKDTKYFTCKCQRCSDPTELGTYLSAMKCFGDDKGSCDGIHLPEDPLDEETDWACSKCTVKVNNSQINMLISQMGEEVENVQMMGGSVTMLENLLCRLSTFLHPNHYHLYSIKHSLVQLYGRQPSYMSGEILDKKIKMCKDLIAITTTLDPGNARLSLYSAVLQHELHSALLLLSKKAKSDGSIKTIDEIIPLLSEAKLSLDKALASLKDDIEETSGKKLYEVIESSKKEFDKYCKEKKINI